MAAVLEVVSTNTKLEPQFKIIQQQDFGEILCKFCKEYALVW